MALNRSVFSLLSRLLSLLLLLLLLPSPDASLLAPAATSSRGWPPSASGNLSAYDVLQSFDFPVGILPKGVVGYDFDPDTGGFSAYFNGSCDFSLKGSYQLRYRSTISGRISRDNLRDLEGVSVKVLFFWLNIIKVTRRGDQLEFSVGIASADFAIDNFLQCPQCGCGFDCHSLRLPSGKGRSPLKWRMASS